MKVLVINGANLNALGYREPEIYGTTSLSDLENMLKDRAGLLGVSIYFFQSNCEGAIIDAIYEANANVDFMILNPGAYAHYSIAIRDAISSVSYPVTEVHISNIYAREEFRKTSCISPVCSGTISGFGLYGYIMALEAGVNFINLKS